MTKINKVKCEKCDVRIPASHPRLFCSICKKLKHAKCQFLSRLEANEISSNIPLQWSCYDCISSILPINACQAKRRSHDTVISTKFKHKCEACNGYSYTPNNVIKCEWCDKLCHKKCVKGQLGCLSCCVEMNPGFDAQAWELFDDPNHANDYLFNPYNPSHLFNNIGDKIENELEQSSMWQEVSNFLSSCKYKQLKDIVQSKHNELKTFNLNIRSLYKHIDPISEIIETLKKCDVLCFNETSCNVEKLPHGITDILLEHFHAPVIKPPYRKSNKGGGLATYVNKSLCKEEDITPIDIGQDSPDGEFMFVKIRNCKNTEKTVILGNVYRSPSSSPQKFIEIYDGILDKLDKFKSKHALISGDFNIDLIKHESDVFAQNLLDTTAKYGFAQTISRPTRITDHSATLIDHVYSNMISKVISSSVITADLTDHLATTVTISLDSNFDNSTWRNCGQIYSNDRNDKREFRIFSEANSQKFQELINAEAWDIPEGLNAEQQYDKFLEIYMQHYNAAFPLKSERVRRKKERLDPKPWILPWLEEACDRKNRLYFIFVQDPTTENDVKYKKMKAFVEKHISKAKAKYYHKYFLEHQANSKKQWQMINTLLKRNKKKVEITKLIDDNGNCINNAKQISEKFNSYFANIAENLKSNHSKNEITSPSENFDFEKYMGPAVTRSMFLEPTSSTEVHAIINGLKNKTTLDTKISALKIANNSEIFVEAFAKIINNSFEQGIFPDSLKIAKVVPIHKEGPKTAVENYRPISLLTAFSKIFEKLMHRRIVEFLDSNGSLYEEQYGFRAGRSCEYALLNAQNTISNSLSKNQVSLLLLLDFSKAFDMVEHNILLRKLSHYGIRGNTYNWMKSYLSNRKQYVSTNGENSSLTQIKYGVPQGSILGPLLFIIYINDIPNICKIAKFILYADDANIIITGKDEIEVWEELQKINTALVNWVNSNGLALNLKKTKYMIFTRKREVNLSLNVVINKTKIERKNEARFLGVIVDEKLNWTKHIQAIKSKMSKYVGIMYKIKHSIPLQARLLIYHSLVQSHLNFCSSVWGFSCKSNIDSLHTVQKKAIRAVMPGYVKYYYKDGVLPTHTKSAFKEYTILTAQSVIAKNALILMSKIHMFVSNTPQSIRKLIPPNSPSHNASHNAEVDWIDIYIAQLTTEIQYSLKAHYYIMIL